MRNYAYAVVAVLILVFVLGFIAPTLVSSASTEGVIIGVIFLILTPVVLFGLYKKWIGGMSDEE